MNVQTRVAAYIRNSGIRKSAICERTGITDSTLSVTLSGKRRMTADEFEKICLAIRKSPNDFMCLKEGPR